MVENIRVLIDAVILAKKEVRRIEKGMFVADLTVVV
jgi:hypothetical protein